MLRVLVLPAAVGFFSGFFACAALVWMPAVLAFPCILYRSISVAPVRGRHLLFFACRKEK
jgi:hypothetical protein